MTVSGTTTFSMTVEQIVVEARAQLGIQEAEEPLQAHELTQGIRALNMMLRAWQIDGIKTWTLTEGSFSLAQSDYDYVFGAGGTFTTVPLEITDVRITRNSQDLPMNRMSREEYQSLPVKSTEGYPTQYYYDRQQDGGTMYVWPAPDATAGTIKFTYRRYLYDVGVGTATLDIPKEWYEAVTYNLAKRLLAYYPGVHQNSIKLVMEMAPSSYAQVKNFDVGEGMGSIMVVPA
jgi:hypothetical protein